jgi:hypothetical protein
MKPKMDFEVMLGGKGGDKPSPSSKASMGEEGPEGDEMAFDVNAEEAFAALQKGSVDDFKAALRRAIECCC